MKKIFTSLLLICSIYMINAQAPGQIMFVGFDADDQTSFTDQFAFVNLFPIPAGTVIEFSDGEGTATWTSPASDIASGSVININVAQSGSGTTSATQGTVSVSGSFNLSGTNEIIEAIKGGICLAAIANDASVSLDACGSLNTDFVVRISGDEDIMSYTGSTTCDGTLAACQAMITDPSNWTTDDGSGDQTASYSPPAGFAGALLPVDLVKFEVNEVNGEVSLSWVTGTEVNNSHFDILHSTDGTNYRTIGTVEGAGYSSEEISYKYMDYAAKSGLHYYKLKQVDFDNRSEIFEAAIIEIRNENQIRLYPTTVTGILNVEGVDENAALEIFSALGQLVLRAELSNSKVDISVLNSGSYFVRINDVVLPFVKM